MDSNPSVTPLQPKKKIKCLFLDYVQLLLISRAGQWTWTPLLPLSSQKNKMLVLDYIQLLMIGHAGWWTQTPSATPFQLTKMKCSFLDYVQLLMISCAINGLEPHLPPLSSQKNKMLVFELCSTSGDRLGWSIDSNPICHPSPAKKIKFLFLDYVQLLMIGHAGQ